MSHFQRQPSGRHLKLAKVICSEKKQFIFEQVFSNTWTQQLLKLNLPLWRERVFSPLVTIWVFINQILSQDHSCRMAVASLLALRSFQGFKSISTSTGAYCRARQRLPLSLIQQWALTCAQRLMERAPSKWLWNGFEVFLVDGSHISMPDTKANRELYHPAVNSCGLPKARVLGIFSLSCGSLIDFNLGPWRGKGTGEVSMFRALLGRLHKGQLVVMDRLFGGYVDMGLLDLNQIDFVVRAHAGYNPQRGERLGKGDHLIELTRPWHRAKSVSDGFLDLIAKKLVVRQVLVRIKQKGFRTKRVLIFTSLKDHKKYSHQEIAALYAKRWNVEVDFRSLKIGLGLDVLRCQTPAMVEKEAWMHVLVYNMIRVVMAEASDLQRLRPRQMSFQECVQLVEHFRILFCISQRLTWTRLYEDLVLSMKTRVGARPNRREPRLLKHNPQKYRLLKKPREEVRDGYWKTGWAREKREREIRAA